MTWQLSVGANGVFGITYVAINARDRRGERCAVLTQFATAGR
jgi:hypothetical protein